MPKWGRWGSASENVPSPVQWPRPMKISEPMPAASSPGSITSSSAAPPIPDASISRNAPIIGEPSSVLIAAKLPADATTTFALSGASRLASRTAQTPSPPPRAISGASGPSTIAEAQGRQGSEHDAGQLARRRSAARLEPVGRRVPAGAGQVPDRERDQHAGDAPAAVSATTAASACRPRPRGRLVKIHPCSLLTSARNPKAAADTGTPMIAASASSAR